MRYFALATACLLALSCGGTQEKPEPAATTATAARPLPSPEDAATIISSAAEFSDFQSPYSAFSLPLKESMMNAPTLQNAKELESAGWIRFRDGAVELTDKAQTDRRWLVRQNGFVEIVPLAKKELIAVTAVRPAGGGNAEADFNWKWIPNEIGEVFATGPVKERFASPHKGKATLQPSATGGWEVLILEAVGT